MVKCPECGAPSVVKETRSNKRRRVCFNDHTFTTNEVIKSTEHGEGCWRYGSAHYMCALDEIYRLQDELNAKHD